MPKVKTPFTSLPGRAYWGLTIQKGPWKSTYTDYKRAHQVPGGAMGGGIAVGGTGEGKYDRVMTPYVQDATKPLPDTSEYATQSIVRPGESWFLKKPAAGAKRASLKKASLVIRKTPEQINYEDISHKEGKEPNIPPPPPDLTARFLTEERLLQARKPPQVSKIIGVEMMEESPQFPHRMLLQDSSPPEFVPPVLDLVSSYKEESLSRKELMEGQAKRLKTMKGSMPGKLDVSQLPPSRQAEESSIFSMRMKQARAEKGSVAKKKDVVPMPPPEKGKLRIDTSNVPPSKQSSTKAKGVRAESGSVAKTKDVMFEMPKIRPKPRAKKGKPIPVALVEPKDVAKPRAKKVDRRSEIEATRREFRTMQNPTAMRIEHSAEMRRAFKHLKP